MSNYHLSPNQELELRERERYLAAANQNSAIARIVNIVYFVFGLLEVLLGFRVLLHLIGANPADGFVAFVYTLSYPFVTLFTNLLRDPAFSTTSVLEITTLIAMIVYAVFAWILGRVIWLTLSRPR